MDGYVPVREHRYPDHALSLNSISHLGGRNPHFGFKYPAEIIYGMKSKFKTDLFNTAIGIEEQLCCPNNFKFKVVLNRRHTSVFLEHFPEI